MLELVEPFVELTRRIRNRQDVLAALQNTCNTFGFRSGVMLGYSQDLSAVADFLDTSETRRPLWKKVNPQDFVQRIERQTTEPAGRDRVVVFEATSAHPYRTNVIELDQMDGVSVPIRLEGGIVGEVQFSGTTLLSDKEADALHFIAHLLFCTFRAVQHAVDKPPHKTLTPREKEVMIETSRGYTSPEIAQMLGLSERTVNQHIENVAYKFGTKNRLHTVANLLRLNLLD